MTAERRTVASEAGSVDSSPEALAFVLANAAERIRTAPEGHLTHCAVLGASAVLRGRLDDRMAVSPEAARDAAEGS
jgi:hypothetical protein